MELLIRFFSISCLSTIIIADSPFPSERRMRKIIEEGRPITDSPNINLKLLQQGQLFRNKFTLVWKGTYNDTTPVAIKICHNEETVEEEMDLFRRLNAEDADIEKYRVPRVYYHGPVLGEYFAIVMTFFDGNLEDRFILQDSKFSDITVLSVFKQIMEGFKYIHSRKVAHYSTSIINIFTRDQDIFLGDFALCLLEENLMYDYNALLLWVWRMIGLPPDKLCEPDAVKFAYFENPSVRNAFQSIMDIKDIRRRNYTLPNYEKVIRTADEALTEIIRESGPIQLDWLDESSSGESSS